MSDILTKVIPERFWPDKTRVHVNPTGRFVKGGPVADTGLTGRKLAVDAYGPVAHLGGGTMSGKDPTKVDRTGAYAPLAVYGYFGRGEMLHTWERVDRMEELLAAVEDS